MVVGASVASGSVTCVAQSLAPVCDLSIVLYDDGGINFSHAQSKRTK